VPEYSYACDSCEHRWSVVCSMSKYTDRKKCPSCNKIKAVHRDYSADEVYGAYSYSLSEAKTIGHYADKQTKRFGKRKVEDMIQQQKTKRVDNLSGKLPDGMKRIERPKSPTNWTGSKKKRRGRKK